MYIVCICGQIPPKEWEHDPLIKNNDNFTVSMLIPLFLN